MKGNETIPQARIKDVLITRTAIKLLKPESVVDKIVSFQFKDAIVHTKIVNEIEISGFGKFYVSQAKLRKKVKKLNIKIEMIDRGLSNPEIIPERKRVLELKRTSAIAALALLKTKQNENRLEGVSRGTKE